MNDMERIYHALQKIGVEADWVEIVNPTHHTKIPQPLRYTMMGAIYTMGELLVFDALGDYAGRVHNVAGRKTPWIARKDA